MKAWILSWGLAAAMSLVLSGCAQGTVPVPTESAVNQAVTLTPPPSVGTPLTLKQIMADPDWIGNAPEKAYWADDGQGVYFQQKQQGTHLRDRFYQPLNGEARRLPLSSLPLEQWGRVSHPGKTNAEGSLKAWLYQGNLFLRSLPDGAIEQLTRDNQAIAGFRFLADGRIAFWRDERVEALNPSTGERQLLAELKFANRPEPARAEGFLAEQQQRLIRYVDKEYQRAQQKFDRRQARQAQDPTLAPAPIYLGEQERLVELSLSPSGRYAVVALVDKGNSWRGDHDIMPNYLERRGYVDPIQVRARVAEAKIAAHRLVVLDLVKGSKTDVTYEGLEGYNEDVLAAVKRENAEARSEQYLSQEVLRTIRLMQDWGWAQSAMQWHEQEDRLAVMMEAADNKDRWIATVDLTEGRFVTQHRLHDDAWINYTHNEFGWYDADNLYYLSEESGYSHLYLKPLKGQPRALTSGEQVVSRLTLSRDKRHFYYQANPTHPGQYEVYRVAVADGSIEALTALKGRLDYQLSPGEDKLLLSLSHRTRPMELYVKPLDGEARQLTYTTSETFLAYPWQAPDVVAMPSSHQDKPVYARVFLPQEHDPAKTYPAVIFTHGAGYLQNAHYGWSGYFREYLFHNLLAQQGYVVMDIDYRGSKGYGRDWRTAIYRNMGHSEVEDMADGIDWMVANAGVDRQRVGTYGGSYGGFLTFMALFTQPELFQAGAALRPVTDWAHYNHGYTSNILNTPDEDPIAYNRSSPIEFAQGLDKPLLIMSGMLDDNVFFQDSVRLVQRLIELEKPMFETAIYPVEPHGFKEPSSWLDEYRRIHRLFEVNLKP